MKDEQLIISETQRPFWQLVIAALLFTLSVFTILISFYYANWSFSHFISTVHSIEFAAIIMIVATGFCSQKRIYIDLKNSKFKPSLEIGFVKFGKWKTINDYEYISVFYDPSKKESERFEVNLWYDSNKHFELYTRNNFEDAMTVGYEISEQLKIDLLDATIKGDHKWIDKEELIQNSNE